MKVRAQWPMTGQFMQTMGNWLGIWFGPARMRQFHENMWSSAKERDSAYGFFENCQQYFLRQRIWQVNSFPFGIKVFGITCN